MKNIIYILIFLPLICIGQTISINGSLHSTNGDNTFPIWVEEGTTIQPNSPIKSISIKEFNVVQNSNGNDLVFNKTVLVYNDSISKVPEGKTWKLESTQNGLQVGDEYAGGIVFYMDDTGGGKVFAPGVAQTTTSWSYAIGYCEDLTYNGFNDWYISSAEELIILSGFRLSFNLHLLNDWSWANNPSVNTARAVSLQTGETNELSMESKRRVIPIRQF